MKFFKHILLLAALGVIPVFFSQLTLAQPKSNAEVLTFTAINHKTYDMVTGEIIKEAYRRIGITTLILFLPPARALAMASLGKVDGEVSRIFKLGEQHKNLVRVPVPYLTFKSKIFSVKSNIKVYTASDLAKYTSGIIVGVLYSEQLTRHYPRIQMASAEQLFRMLLADHPDLDLAIVSEFSGRIILAKKFPNKKIHMSHQSLIEVPVYHYLHQRHIALLPKITQVLKEMYESGETSAMKEAFILSKIRKAKDGSTAVDNE